MDCEILWPEDQLTRFFANTYHKEASRDLSSFLEYTVHLEIGVLTADRDLRSQRIFVAFELLLLLLMMVVSFLPSSALLLLP